MLAKRWTLKEKALLSQSARWHNTLDLFMSLGVALVTFLDLYFFYIISTSQPTNIIITSNAPFNFNYPSFMGVLCILSLLPVLLVLIRKTRKMGARWCLLITVAINLRLVFDSSVSVPLGNHLFLCLYYLPCAILLMKDWNLPPTQPEMNSAAAQF